MSEFEKSVGKETMDLLTQAMKTPQGATNLLNQLPSTERNKVIGLLADPTKWSTKGGLTGTAAMRETAKSLMSEE